MCACISWMKTQFGWIYKEIFDQFLLPYIDSTEIVGPKYHFNVAMQQREEVLEGEKSW